MRNNESLSEGCERVLVSRGTYSDTRAATALVHRTQSTHRLGESGVRLTYAHILNPVLRDPLIQNNPIPHYILVPTMEGIPHPSDALVQAAHHPAPLDPPHLLPVGVPQQLHLLQDLLLFEVPHAYDLFPAVDVRAPHYGMRVGSWGDVDDDLRMGLCERGEEWRAEEGTVWWGKKGGP